MFSQDLSQEKPSNVLPAVWRLAKELTWLKLSIFTQTPTAWLSQQYVTSPGKSFHISWPLMCYHWLFPGVKYTFYIPTNHLKFIQRSVIVETS